MSRSFTFKFEALSLFLIIWCFKNGQSEIIVYKNTSTDTAVRVIADYELNMGADIPDEGTLAYIISAEPESACSEIKPPPKDSSYYFGNNSNFDWFVLIDRDYCELDKKLTNVKNAGYDGVIIYNARLTSQIDLGDRLIVDFPVLLVTHVDGRQIKSYYTYEKGYFAKFNSNSPFHIYPFLVPFLVVIGACIIVIVSFMVSQIIRCYNESRKRHKDRLAKHDLKKIPTINFKKGDHYEICAICLEEFKERMKLRLLPCGHAYHKKCVDTWLVKKRRNCPICKGEVVVPDMTESESENENENERDVNNASERTPLLASGSNQQASSENSSSFIFPIGRRARRAAAERQASSSSGLTDQNQPSTSSNSTLLSGLLDVVIARSTNQPQVSVQGPSSTSRRNFLFGRSNRNDHQRRSRMQVNVEINSPRSPMQDDHHTIETSDTVNLIDDHQADDLNQTTSTSRSIDDHSSKSDANTTTATIDQNASTSSFAINSHNTSQRSSNTNYGTTYQSRSSRRDNIV